jgi:hypothetical protein
MYGLERRMMLFRNVTMEYSETLKSAAYRMCAIPSGGEVAPMLSVAEQVFQLVVYPSFS